jgi:hypothetical protein
MTEDGGVDLQGVLESGYYEATTVNPLSAGRTAGRRR